MSLADPAESGVGGARGPAKASAHAVLGAPRRPIARYRPAVLAAGLLGVMLLVGAGVMVAFGGGPSPAAAPAEPAANTEAPGPAPIDARLPATYGELGPPPGWRPAPASTPVATPPPATSAMSPSDAAQQQRQQEILAARRSGPFFGGAAGSFTALAAPSAASSAAPSFLPSVAPGADDGAQVPFLASAAAAPTPMGGAEAFIARASASSPTAVASLPQPPLSPFEVKAGTVISAALITGLDSDLPGMVIAQVTEPVFDHRSGRVVLIPQGARLIGKYDSQVGYGQNRVLLVWTRLIWPSGRSMDLGGMTGADATGAAGLSDQVDTHLPVLARAIGLSTLIAIGGAAAQNSLARSNDNLVLQDSAEGLAGQASQTGQRLVERDLQRRPTLRIRPGFPVRIMVDRDLILPPEVAGDR